MFSGRNSERSVSAVLCLIPRGLGRGWGGTYGSNGLGIGDVVGDDFAEFGEMPAEPFTESHHVVVDFFIEVFQQGDGLDDHGINLFG
jgi:hypothetical protein